MAKISHRVLHDMGPKRTAQWLANWCGDEEDFSIECLSIHAPDIARLSRDETDQLVKLRSKNQSELHCYLKFATMKWLKENSSHPDTVFSEVICYAPLEELADGITFLDIFGRKVKIHLPHILYENSIGFPLSYGITARLDLHSFDTAAEVGGTEPFNLLMPLFEGLADQSLWVPYPLGVETSSFEHRSGGLGSIRAYMIRLHEPPRARKRRTPAMNSRGAHPYPLSQWTFATWFIGKYGDKAPARADKQADKLFKSGDLDASMTWRVMASYLSDMLAESTAS